MIAGSSTRPTSKSPGGGSICTGRSTSSARSSTCWSREKRDLAATRRFFTRALEHGPRPTEVTTDRAPAYPRVLDELLPAAWHVMEQYANNPIEADHGRLKSRLRPMRGLKQLRSARVISAGHAFIQNLRRGHYELGFDADPRHRLRRAFTELTLAI